MDLQVFQQQNRKIVFEVEGESNSGQFLMGKRWLNDRALRTGRFPEFAAQKILCRDATPIEVDEYTALKDRSNHALNAN